MSSSRVRERFLFPREPLLHLADLGGRSRERAPRVDEGWDVTLGHSARYALYRLLQGLPRTSRDEVLVPAFVCIALVEPILAAGYKVRFFDNPSLTETDLDLIRGLATDRTLAVVAVHFFGFRQDTAGLAALCRDRGILLIENFTHSLPVRDFVAAKDRLERCDVALFSLKKMLPAPDGGFAVHRRSLGAKVPRESSPARLPILQELYRSAERTLQTRRWRPSNREAANPVQVPQADSVAAEIAASMHGLDLDRASWGVSTASRRIWEGADLDAIAAARRRNFGLIREDLRGMPEIEFPFRDAPANSCLWGIPFQVRGIPDYDYKLRSIGLPVFTFARALHPGLGRDGFPNARAWAAQMKVLPVHQDLTPEDIATIKPAFEALLARRLG